MKQNKQFYNNSNANLAEQTSTEQFRKYFDFRT